MTLNIPISEGGTNLSHTHNLDKFQSYQGPKLLLSDTKFMAIVNSMLIYHRLQEINVWHMLVSENGQVPIF